MGIVIMSASTNDELNFCYFADSLKMLALERVRGKFFTRAWGEFIIHF